jgi:hypothetical protein
MIHRHKITLNFIGTLDGSFSESTGLPQPGAKSVTLASVKAITAKITPFVPGMNLRLKLDSSAHSISA